MRRAGLDGFDISKQSCARLLWVDTGDYSLLDDLVFPIKGKMEPKLKHARGHPPHPMPRLGGWGSCGVKAKCAYPARRGQHTASAPVALLALERVRPCRIPNVQVSKLRLGWKWAIEGFRVVTLGCGFQGNGNSSENGLSHLKVLHSSMIWSNGLHNIEKPPKCLVSRFRVGSSSQHFWSDNMRQTRKQLLLQRLVG